MPLLSILIPSTFDRSEMLMALVKNIYDQAWECNAGDEVEIITDVDNRERTTGFKRNSLLHRASGDMVVAIDDDDEISVDYISSILEAMEGEPDVISFNGHMTHDGERRENFRISKDLDYVTVKDINGNNEYHRFNNHLCPLKRSIALQIGFKDITYAEDFDFAVRLKESGLIKTEVYIQKDLYHYKYISKK